MDRGRYDGTRDGFCWGMVIVVTNSSLELHHWSFSLFHILSCSALTTQDAAVKGTVVLNIFMMVLSSLHHAIDLCNSDGIEVFTAVHSVDSAVAFYTGLQQTKEDPGYLLYNEAETMCEYFNTCDDPTNVNTRIMEQFNVMQDNILQGECTTASETLLSIESLMYIPMVQGVLYYAYQMGEAGLGLSPSTHAVAAMYAASILPKVYAYGGPEDADILYTNMQLGYSEVDFAAVKNVLEKNYMPAFQVTCADVGGIWEQTGYAAGAAPCESDDATSTTTTTTTTTTPGTTPSQTTGITTGSSKSSNAMIALGVLIAAAFVLVVVCCCRRCRRQRQDKKAQLELPSSSSGDFVAQTRDLS